MKQATTFRGQPLLVFVGVLFAWFGLRVALWQPASDLAIAELPGLAGGLPGGWAPIAADPVLSLARPQPASFDFVRPVEAGSRPPSMILPATVTAPAGLTAAAGRAQDHGGLAVGHNLLLAAGLARMELPPSLAAYLHGASSLTAGIPAGAPFVVALPQPAPPWPGSRLSADAWLMVRQDTTSAVVSGRPSYGRSQAGGVVRYRLAPSSPLGLQAYLRASSALQGALERDLVAGFSARPMPNVPLRFAAEARISETAAGIELRPAALAVTELPRLRLPLRARAEAYLQGGYVAGRFATAFVDGQLQIERRVAQFGRTEIAAGAGAWGGAQKGAARLDIGPTAAVSFRLGDGHGRVAADYRFRVAGDAEPSSGPALTLSAGF